MSSVIKRNFRTFDSLNFIDRVKADQSGAVEHVVYVGLSKNTEWPNELIPPVPQDTIKAQDDFWDEVIGFQRISPSDVTLVVPRINWENGAKYVQFSETSDQAYGQRFYCVNSLYQVFRVEEVYQSDPVTVTEPIFSTNPVIDTNDGYKWRFMYDLSVRDINETVQDTWLPVNIGDRQTARQITYGDTKAEWTLGARHVLLRTKITDQGIPLNVSYRQLAVLLDITDASDTKITATNALPADVKAKSGLFLYLENRKQITRETGQSEEPKIVVQF